MFALLLLEDYVINFIDIKHRENMLNHLSFEQQEMLGLTSRHVVPYVQGDRTFYLHHKMLSDFKRLQHSAKQAGFDLALVSGFRDFERQLTIFSAKATGQRVLLDSQAQPLVFEDLSEFDLLMVILRWSALPGASRHHWGCDVDVYDANKIALSEVQLVPQEVEGDGCCAAMHNWLDEKIKANQSFGFFRPYALDSGGIAPERWHLSYAPQSLCYEKQLSSKILKLFYQGVDLPLKDVLIEQWDQVFERFVKVRESNYPNWYGG